MNSVKVAVVAGAAMMVAVTGCKNDEEPKSTARSAEVKKETPKPEEAKPALKGEALKPEVAKSEQPKPEEPATDATTDGQPAATREEHTKHATPFDALRTTASTDTVAPDEDDAWALFSGTVKDCDGTTLSAAPGENDFEKHDNEAKRNAIRASKIGKQYYIKHTFTHSADADAGDLSTSGDTDYFALALGNYDFKKQQFKFAISGPGDGLGAGTGSSWSVGGPDPKWARESQDWVTSKRIGSIGGKDLKVDTVEEDRFYLDPSILNVTWKTPEANARAWLAKDQNITLEVVTTFLGLGFQKACTNFCTTFLGARDCSKENNGIGPYIRNTIDAVRVSTDEQILYEVVKGKVTTPVP